jgi:hypothetical protein
MLSLDTGFAFQPRVALALSLPLTVRNQPI